MNTVPKMISGKDLDYIYDMFAWNFLANKKANHFLKDIKDDEIKKLVKKSGSMHKKFAEQLVEIIK